MLTPPLCSLSKHFLLSSSRFCEPRETQSAISKKFITCRMYSVQYPSQHLNATSITQTFCPFSLQCSAFLCVYVYIYIYIHYIYNVYICIDIYNVFICICGFFVHTFKQHTKKVHSLLLHLIYFSIGYISWIHIPYIYYILTKGIKLKVQCLRFSGI